MLGTLAAVLLAVAGATVLGWSFAQVLVAGSVVLAACGLAAHRTVSSGFAGLALLLIRPYASGERVRIQSPTEPRAVDAVIVHIGIANTTLAWDAGVLVVPNNLLLRNPPMPVESERCAEPCG